MLTTVLAFIAALALLVVVHELGHFAMARWYDVKVLRFSFGFGPTLWSRRHGPDATEWAICAIPLGGYVRMVDESEARVAVADLPRAFNRQPLRARTLIVLAGPVANLVLAVILFGLVGLIGVRDLQAIIAAPSSGSAAERAGLVAGDRIVSLDGSALAGWSEVRWKLAGRAFDGTSVDIEVEASSGVRRSVHLTLPVIERLDPEQDALRLLGLSVARPRIEPVIGEILPGSRAEKSGLQVNDRVIAVDARPIATWSELTDAARAAPERELALEIERHDERLILRVTPERVGEAGRAIGRIGASVRIPADYQDQRVINVRYGPLDAVTYGVRQTWETSALTVRLIGRMIVGTASLKNISGPVTIADFAGKSAASGVTSYLQFLALISVSLGVLNLLPIPILDGGHLLYYLFEATSGRPLSPRAMAIGQQFGLMVLALLMMFAFYNDFTRLFSG